LDWWRVVIGLGWLSSRNVEFVDVLPQIFHVEKLLVHRWQQFFVGRADRPPALRVKYLGTCLGLLLLSLEVEALPAERHIHFCPSNKFLRRVLASSEGVVCVIITDLANC